MTKEPKDGTGGPKEIYTVHISATDGRPVGAVLKELIWQAYRAGGKP